MDNCDLIEFPHLFCKRHYFLLPNKMRVEIDGYYSKDDTTKQIEAQGFLTVALKARNFLREKTRANALLLINECEKALLLVNECKEILKENDESTNK